MIKRLQDRDPDVRREASAALGKLGNARAVEPLIKCLEDKPVRRAAATALGQLGDARAVEPLIKCLGDKWVRPAACEALGRLGDERAVDPLIKYLKIHSPFSLDRTVQRAACNALGRLGDPRAVEPLIKCLKEEDSDVRRAACEALGQLGDVRAVEPLMRNLNGSSADEAAQASLDAIYHRASSDFERYLCKEHLTHFEPRTIQASNHTVHYFGCRVCSNAGKPWQGVNTVVCVLDSAVAERCQPQFDTASGRLRVRWQPSRRLFDFDVIEIHKASDKDLEQLCIKVGNNEDPRCRDCCTQVKRVIGYCALSDYIWAMLRDRFPKAKLLRKDHERQNPEHAASTGQTEPNPQPGV